MGEISLICPGCGAEYRVPREAVPAGGREVECSGCGHVWRASAGIATRQAPAAAPMPLRAPGPAAPRPAASAPGADEPPMPAVPLRERLPENVLNILRDEVEHERRIRAAEAGRDAVGQDAAATDSPAAAAPEPEWPASTVTRPAADAPAPEPGEAASANAPQPVEVAPASDLVPAGDSRAGYRAGVAAAAMIAAGLLALYLLAPAMTDAGPVGDALTAFREAVDRGRLWLHG